MADSVRERILKELILRFQSMKSPATEWHIIQREPFDVDAVGMFSNLLSVLDTDEPYNYITGFIEPNLRVELEFLYRPKQGDVASTVLNKMLSDLATIVLTNTALVETDTEIPLTLNMQIAESGMDIEGPRDDLVSGFLMFDVMYRFKATDPTALR